MHAIRRVLVPISVLLLMLVVLGARGVVYGETPPPEGEEEPPQIELIEEEVIVEEFETQNNEDEGEEQEQEGEKGEQKLAIEIPEDLVTLHKDLDKHIGYCEEGVKIVVWKVVCDDESYLPNWGAGDNGVPGMIAWNTARRIVWESEGHCHFANNWNFERAVPSQVANPGDDYLGLARGNRSQIGPTSDFGRQRGIAATCIEELDEEVDKLVVREALKPAFIPFSYGLNEETNSDDYSAEMYCHTNIKNYDNYDKVQNIEPGGIYYCVAFNAPKTGAIKIHKYECPWRVDMEDEQWIPDSDGNLGFDPVEEFGCTVGPDHVFGYSRWGMPDGGPDGVVRSSIGDMDERRPEIDRLGKTNKNGKLRRDLARGMYSIGELDDGWWKDGEEMLGFVCDEPERDWMQDLQPLKIDNDERPMPPDYYYVMNPRPLFIIPGRTRHCVVVNPQPGAISVTKYECPWRVRIHDGWFFDQEGELEVNPEEYGCELAGGHDFGIVEEFDNDRFEDDGEINKLCTTRESDGTCSQRFEAGEYLVGELDGDGRKDSEDMYAFDCTSPRIWDDGPPKKPTQFDEEWYENPLYVDVVPGEITRCVAYNPKPVDIKVTKYECPEWLDIEGYYENDLVKRESDGHDGYIQWLIDNGCTLGEGFDFGTQYTEFFPYETMKGEPEHDERDGIVPLCTTDATGMCSGEMDAGPHRFGELDGDEWKSGEEMMDIWCEYEGGPMTAQVVKEKDEVLPPPMPMGINPTFIFPSRGDSLSCIALNPKPLEPCDGRWYGVLEYGKTGPVTFPLDLGYSDEMLSITQVGPGVMEVDFYGSRQDEFTYLDASLTLLNAHLAADVAPSYDGGDALENHEEGYDVVVGDEGATSLTFSLRRNSSSQWHDIFEFAVETADECQALIQGRKFYDVNENGVFDKEEKTAEGDINRLDGWMITVYDTDWNEVDAMETGDDSTPAGPVDKGQYRFVGLDAGDYYVCEEERENWMQTVPVAGVSHPDTGLYCFEITLVEGQQKNGVQFGNVEVIPVEPVCGNEEVEYGEACDDGNTENGDGCDEFCQIEEPSSSGQSSSVGRSSGGDTTPPPSPQTVLLETGPTDGGGGDEGEGGDLCNDDEYIVERYLKLKAKADNLIKDIPPFYQPSSATLGFIERLLERFEAIEDDQERNEAIKKVICKIEMVKEKEGLKYKHIGYNSGHDYVHYLLQYIQDRILLLFTP